MDKRQLVIALLALVVVFAAAFGLSFTQMSKPEPAKVELAAKQEERLDDACGSSATYSRLKQVAFEEAIRIRNADPANLDTLATHSVVRMENPVVKSRDDELNVTVCTGRFVLELPPGAERGFGGQRRLTAEVEYAAQAAADGSGLVYRINGAEPIIYKLATFDLQGQRFQPPQEPQVEFAEAAPPPDLLAPIGSGAGMPPQRPGLEPDAPAPRPQSDVEPETSLEQVPAPRQRRPRRLEQAERGARGGSNPSFNCRSARSRSERMVCGSGRLAAKDRAMSSVFYSALADADPRTRRELRRTRDRFLSYRERCGGEACVADAYDGRVAEIRDIMADSE